MKKVQSDKIALLLRIFEINVIFLVNVFFIHKYRTYVLIFDGFVIFNFILYYIMSASNSQKKVQKFLKGKDIEKSLKVLKIATASMSILSWLTTSSGLEQFIFRDKFWQAALASFAIQIILLVLSLSFCQLFQWLKNNDELSERFGRILSFIILLLLIISLFCSSLFSYVFMIEGIYKDYRVKDENIIIENFLVEQGTLLYNENEKLGEYYREQLADVIKEVNTILNTQQETGRDKIMEEFIKYIDSINCTEYDGEIKENQKFTIDAMNQMLEDNNGKKKSELSGVFAAFNGYYDRYENLKRRYQQCFIVIDTIQTNLTALNESKEDFYQKVKDNILLKVDWNTQYKTIINLKNSISTLKKDVKDYQGYQYNKELNSYKASIFNELDNLQWEVDILIMIFDKLNNLFIEYESIDTTINKDEIDLSQIASILINNETTSVNIEELVNDIQSKITLIKYDTELGQKVLDTEKLNSLNNLLIFFQKYKNYLDLKSRIEDFLNKNLQVNYIIITETTDILPTECIQSSIMYVSENDWKEYRKKDIIQFIGLIKSLQESNENIDYVKNFDQTYALEMAYTLNRDLLEDISVLETAINYFKYDYNLMAYLALFLALFFDLGAFGAGFLFFALGNYKKNNNSE